MSQPRVVLEGVQKSFTRRHTRSLKESAVWSAQRRKLNHRFRAVDHVDLHVREGESLALVGHNGSGKSTLLKLVAGVLVPDAGRVLVRGRVAGLIEVGAGLHRDLTGRENIALNGAILGMSPSQVRQRFDAIVDFSELEEFLDTQVRFYSSGMFLRLAFAVAVHTDPDLFLVDEILAVGDEPFRRKCLDRVARMRQEGRTLVVVSHDLSLLDQVCDRGVVLDHGRVVAQGSVAHAVSSLRARA
ncbi:ABC transporter ATP-binding protein [Angustibacter luteus]|uniref:ABC transporter ATP-binding protein n=1 Tax=Angustibacter luteus TaxID=658456 RepID=A0ABW1JE63_9ACTN